MKTAHHNRLRRLQDVLQNLPVPTALVTAAFEQFEATGELPDDDDRLAEAVLRRAELGYDLAWAYDPRTNREELHRIVLAAQERAPDPERMRLYADARSRDPVVRAAARQRLCELAGGQP